MIDSQALMPAALYPKALRNLLANYLRDTCDPIMGGSTGIIPAFALPLMGFELAFQFPLFVALAYALYMRKDWIRIPGLVYGVHVATTLLPILGHLNLAPLDRTCKTNVANLDQLFKLNLIYAPWFVLPTLFAAKCALKKDYFSGSRASPKRKTK